MPKFAHIDQNAAQPSRVLGWFDTDALAYSYLPEDLIELTDEQWDARQNTPFFSGEGFVAAPPAIPALADLKASKLAEINAKCAALLAAVKAGYPDEEVQSWSKQESEARAFVANSGVATPLLSAIAKQRGLAMNDLAARVIVKADAFAEESGNIIGIRQHCEDAIEAATTAEEVAAVDWSGA